jgi:hypothetical protein
MIFKVIPVEWFPLVLGISIALFLIRIIARIYFYIKEKKNR